MCHPVLYTTHNCMRDWHVAGCFHPAVPQTDVPCAERQHHWGQAVFCAADSTRLLLHMQPTFDCRTFKYTHAIEVQFSV